MNYIYCQRYGGFANSLCIWQFCYELAKINNKQVGIYKYHFPETKFLNFPNTIILDQEPKDLNYIDSNQIESNKFIISNNIDKNIGLSCGWNFSRKLEYEVKNKATSKILFKDDDIQNKINLFCKDKIGIHLRRGDHNHYKNIKTNDNFYINACDNFITKEFYLATDGSKEETLFLQKYKIHRYDVFFDKKYDNVNCHVSGEPKNFKQKMYNINEDLIKIKCIDLMCLSRCKTIIGCKNSTFTLIAKYMGNHENIITEK